MKSFSRFLLEKDNKTSSIKGSSDSYTQPDLFDTSKTGKEDPVKDVKTTKDITGNRRKRGRPIGSKNKVVDPNAPTQSFLDTSKNVDKKYTPPSKTQSQNIQTNSIKNQVSNKVTNSRTIDKVINTNIVKGTDPKTVNKKFGSSTPTGTFTDDLPKTTTKKVDNYTKNLTYPKKGQEITYRNIEKKLKSIDKPKTRKPRTIAKQYLTKRKGPIDVGGTLTRGAELTGLKSIEPKQQIGSELKNIPKDKITKTIIKKTPKKLVFNRALSGLGRVAGGAFAVKDFMDTARKEKALGRSKTAARLKGASKALGGYIGGGIGALAGGLAGGGIASAGLGIAGGIAGYSAGSKAGDYLYKKGRQLVTGKTGEAAKIKFKDFMKKIRK